MLALVIFGFKRPLGLDALFLTLAAVAFSSFGLGGNRLVARVAPDYARDWREARSSAIPPPEPSSTSQKWHRGAKTLGLLGLAIFFAPYFLYWKSHGYDGAALGELVRYLANTSNGLAPGPPFESMGWLYVSISRSLVVFGLAWLVDKVAEKR